MNERMNQYILRIEENLKSAEAYLADTKEHLGASVRENAEELEIRAKRALALFEAKGDQVSSAKERIVHFLEEKKNELAGRYEDWRTDRQIEKLEKVADAREEHAVDLVIAAAHALLEAEIAVIDALKARKVAIEVAG